MADLRKEGTDLVLDLSPIEKAAAKHGCLRMPLSSVVDIEVVDDARAAIGWWTFMGSRLPGYGVGRFRLNSLSSSQRSRQFAAVHRDTPRAVRVRLQGEDFAELLVGSKSPEAVVASLGIGEPEQGGSG